MKRLLNSIGILLGLLALSVLAVVLASTLGGLRGTPEPVSQVSPSPTSTVTPTAISVAIFESPIETPTRWPTPTIPPTVTPAPKPTWTPSPAPTITLVPTALPAPSSAFYALWAENFPEGQGSVLWLADPRDIGSRQEVLRFERDAILEAALSPDGRKLALVTIYWKTGTLWVADADGSDLWQLDQGPGVGGRLFWSRDSRLLAYGISWREETMTPDEKTGTPEPFTVWRGATELVDVATGEKKRLLEGESDETFNILSWSADGQELYYVRSVYQETEREHELWAVDSEGRDARRIASLESKSNILRPSPDASKFLMRTPEGLVWISADGRTRQTIPLPPPRQQCGVTWSFNKEELVLCQVDEQEPIEHIKVLNLRTGAERVLSSFKVSPSGASFGLVALSPDMQWMVASVYQAGSYWIHLPRGMVVPVPDQEHHIIFVAWMPKTPASQ